MLYFLASVIEKLIGYFHISYVVAFCSNNMLYPKEDKVNKVLLYAVSSNTLSTACLYAMLPLNAASKGLATRSCDEKSLCRNWYHKFI